MQHADALEAVVDGAFGAELGVGPKHRELKAEAGQRALQARADLGDDLPQPLRLDLQPRDQVGHQLDERLRVPVEGAPRDDERLQVVVARGQRLHLRRRADATGVGRDASCDLNIILPGRPALREHAAEQWKQVFLIRRED